MASNFFRKPVPDLKPGTSYSFKFQWKYSDGTLGPWSVAKTVLTAGTATVDAPTKATGLSAKTAPFGLLVLWDGTYANDDRFNGFKSINIYASKTDLGSKTTTNISADLVGSMTVDAVKNSVTIGLENLRNTLDLIGEAVYNQDVFLYYISLNENDESYQEGGQNTYYRINSNALRPTKANYIDLASGVISIENLVAGNGQFTSWLRTGLYGTAPGGARIELSSLNSFTATSGGTVVPGLTVYDSSGAKAFRADLQGNVTFSGVLKSTTQENFTPLIDTHEPYIEIPKNSANINLYPNSVSGGLNANKPGYIRVYETPSDPNNSSSYEVAAVEIKPPTYNTGLLASDGYITITENSNLDTYIDMKSKYITLNSGTGGMTLNSDLYITLNTSESYGVYVGNNTPVNQASIRNIKATTSAPLAGNSASSTPGGPYYYGDIWFQYTTV